MSTRRSSSVSLSSCSSSSSSSSSFSCPNKRIMTASSTFDCWARTVPSRVEDGMPPSHSRPLLSTVSFPRFNPSTATIQKRRCRPTPMPLPLPLLPSSLHYRRTHETASTGRCSTSSRPRPEYNPKSISTLHPIRKQVRFTHHHHSDSSSSSAAIVKEVHTVLSRWEYRPSEVLNSWYTKRDLLRIKADAILVVTSMRAASAAAAAVACAPASVSGGVGHNVGVSDTVNSNVNVYAYEHKHNNHNHNNTCHQCHSLPINEYTDNTTSARGLERHASTRHGMERRGRKCAVIRAVLDEQHRQRLVSKQFKLVAYDDDLVRSASVFVSRASAEAARRAAVWDEYVVQRSAAVENGSYKCGCGQHQHQHQHQHGHYTQFHPPTPKSSITNDNYKNKKKSVRQTCLTSPSSSYVSQHVYDYVPSSTKQQNHHRDHDYDHDQTTSQQYAARYSLYQHDDWYKHNRTAGIAA